MSRLKRACGLGVLFLGLLGLQGEGDASAMPKAHGQESGNRIRQRFAMGAEAPPGQSARWGRKHMFVGSSRVVAAGLGMTLHAANMEYREHAAYPRPRRARYDAGAPWQDVRGSVQEGNRPVSGSSAAPRPGPAGIQASGARAVRTGLDLTDEDKLRAHAITEEARNEFLTWLKWTAGPIVFFLGLLGLKGYRDWTVMLKDFKEKLDDRTQKLDERIRQQVDEKVDDLLKSNLTARTNEVLQSAVDARTEIAISRKQVDVLQGRSRELDAELTQFRERLAALGKQAEGTATEFKNRLDHLAADFEGPAGKAAQQSKEQTFLERSRAYAAKLGLTLPEPKMLFRENEEAPGVLAWYDQKEDVYFVSPSKLDSPGLPESSALMGRFLKKNLEMAENLGREGFPEMNLWYDLRLSIVNYLLTTDDVQWTAYKPEHQLSLYRTLRTVEKEAGIPATRKLAVAMFEAFDQGWNMANLNDKILEVNETVRALPNSKLKALLEPS